MFTVHNGGNARKFQDVSFFEKARALEEAGGDIAAVLALYEKAGDVPGALVNRGTIYFKQRNFLLAEQCWCKALESDPAYVWAYFNLGVLFEDQGHTYVAIREYRQVILLQPTYTDAHFNLARLYACEKVREYTMALTHYKLFLEYARPSDTYIKDAQREIVRIEPLVLMPRRVPARSRTE